MLGTDTVSILTRHCGNEQLHTHLDQPFLCLFAEAIDLQNVIAGLCIKLACWSFFYMFLPQGIFFVLVDFTDVLLVFWPTLLFTKSPNKVNALTGSRCISSKLMLPWKYL